MTDLAIHATRLRKRYGRTMAVDGLDLTVPRGAVFGLLGPNGSGKTTTIRMILRVQRPDDGSIEVLGGTVTPEVLDRIGYLPEERGLYRRMTVARQLSFLAELKGVPPRDSRAPIRGWLDRVGLAERADDRVEALSKGMQQKLQFIAAVLHEPDIVILDEPFSGLDPLNQEVLKEIIDQLRNQGRTILFSTHILEHAERLCDHVCIIAHGKPLIHGDVARVKREYGERFVEIVADRWTETAVESVRSMEGVDHLSRDGNQIEVALRSDADPQALLTRLVESGVGLLRFEIREPSLRQIFLERVGSAGGERIEGPDV